MKLLSFPRRLPRTTPRRTRSRTRGARPTLEQVEARIVPANLPMTFSVPGLVARKGVYVGITGQLTQNYTPTNGPYAGRQLPSGSWVVLATSPGDPPSKSDYALTTPTTTSSQAFTPSSTPQTMSVASTTAFPASGQLNIFGGGNTATLSYTSDTSNSFGGVTFVAGSNAAFPSGSSVYLANQTLPLLSLFPNAAGIPQNNDLVSVSVTVPDVNLAPITAGQVVMSVGSPMRLSINANGGIAAPTLSNNPNDRFGLFEWGWENENSLDIDVSEVDQVGFPFTAAISNPAVSITGVSAVSAGGTLATITTATPHNLQAGDTVSIAGIVGASNLNGVTYVANQPGSATQFQVLLPPNTQPYTSGGTVSLLMPAPAQEGMGMIQGRTDMFNAYVDYLTLVDSKYPDANTKVFIRGGANTPGSTVPLGTRITAPQDVVGKIESKPAFIQGVGVAPIQVGQGGQLPVGTTYYYAVTAVGPDGGESMQTTAQYWPTPGSSAILNWEPFPFATGYNVYRATTQTPFNKSNILGSDAVKLNTSVIPAPKAFASLAAATTLPASSIKVNADLGSFPTIGTLRITAPGLPTQLLQYTGVDAANSTFTGVTLGTGSYPAGSVLTLLPNFADTGASAGTPATPPVNNYNYDALNRYFSKAIVDFFDYYTTNTFTIDVSGNDATTFSGKVSTTAFPGYKVLDLVGQAGQFGSKYAGKHVYFFMPFFSTNTNGAIPGVSSYPAPPSWLNDPVESPSEMIFGSDGVFVDYLASGPNDAPNNIQQDILNPIVSAFNRGLTPVKKTNGDWTNVLAPTYWGNNPYPLIGSAVNAVVPAGNAPLSGTYYYAITATDFNASSNVPGETTPSNLRKVTIGAGQNAVLLQWKPINDTAKANITAANPSGGTITLDDVTGYTNQGSVLITIAGVPQIFTYGSIQTGSGTTGTLTNVVPPASVQIPTSGVVYGNVGAATAGGFKIYRGRTPETLALIGTISNGTPAIASFVDDGVPDPATPVAPPFEFYSEGSTANYYAAFLHLQTVSINGLAYGYPYDDQGGFSTNIQMRTPAGVTIGLQPWTDTAQLVATSSSPTTTAGQTFQITVKATTSAGALDPKYRGTVRFVSSDPTAVLPADYTFTEADAGQHVFTVTLKRAGTSTVTVRDGANDLNATVSMTVNPGSAARVAYLKAPQTGAANTPQPVAVVAQDSFGNVATSANGPLKVVGPFGTRLTAFKNGYAFFNLLLEKAGLFKLTVSAPFGSAVSNTFGISNTTYFTLAANGTVRAGSPTDVAVQARRPGGVVDTLFTGTVDLYVGRRLVGSASAVKGIAKFKFTPIQVGTFSLVARQRQKPLVLGVKPIKILPA